ncbi:hypothetical protein ACFXP7_01680 [Microbacterium sp. P06]|uniref:hypothetical protein n=1 Tax=Microbacterium sp. P06 TaxID=3366949 RepID=UPI003745E40C
MKKRALVSILGSLLLVASIAAAPAATAATATAQSDLINVCKSEQLNTVKPSGQALNAQELERAVRTVLSYCDSLDRVSTRDTRPGYGNYLTIRATANLRTGACGCSEAPWTLKVTATGLPTASNKSVSLIWRTNAPGATGGAWQDGPANVVGNSTTYANLPLEAGVMPHKWRVEGFAAFYVGSTERDSASAWAATY